MIRAELYKIVTRLVDVGVSLIPVGEKRHGEKFYKAPFVKSWKGVDPLNFMELIDLMDRKDTTAVAMVLGTPSGRMVCLDLDTKYKIGFEIPFFNRFMEYYPDLYSKMRIEKTPSGGYHVLFRVEGSNELPRSPKLAKRLATQEEMDAEIERGKQNGKEVKNPTKTRCFLEIKCEGGLSQCYPSPDYELFYGEDFHTISWEEYLWILSLCESFNEVPDVIHIKATKEQNDYYSINPYEDFDNSIEAEELLENDGWKFIRTKGDYNYFQKPNKKDNEISAGFNSAKRLYTIWTAGSDIEPKSYSPSNLLCDWKFNGDKKLLYAHLVSKGYGKIKPEREKITIKQAIQCNGVLPLNISTEGLAEFTKEKQRLSEAYPHGIFWEINKEGTAKILREELMICADLLGFKLWNDSAVKIDGKIATVLTVNEFFNELKKYISKEEPSSIFSAYEAFLQNSGKFTISRLEKVDKDLFLKSTKTESYKFFKNCYIRITSEDIDIIGYEKLEKIIWKHSIKEREFRVTNDWKSGIYYSFLDKAIGVNEYVMKCVGYYAHEFRDEQGYFMLTTEKCENPKEGGGSGKNVFWSLMAETTTFKDTAASLIKRDNQLLQSWNGERVFCLSDIPNHFDFIFFKQIITGSAVVKKLYADEYSVPIDEMCKIGGSSNYSYDDSDPGVARRMRPIEFTDYFTNLGDGALYKEYGKMFPKDWTEEDYLGFDNCMVRFIQEFIKDNCVINKSEISVGGWLKQFEQKYGHVADFIKDNISSWIERHRVSNDEYRKLYEEYIRENTIRYTSKAQTHNLAITDYCKHHAIAFKKDGAWKKDTISYRGRLFGEEVKEKDPSVWHSAGKVVDKDEVPF